MLTVSLVYGHVDAKDRCQELHQAFSQLTVGTSHCVRYLGE